MAPAKDKTLTDFQSFGLAEPLVKAVSETGYVKPTPIQLQAIPPVMTGSDVLGIAQTGTGKTAAFALPILHRLAADRRPTPRKGTRALILSPTRELATQIAESFRTYGKHLGFSVTVIFGGVSERPQIERLSRGVDILVATPGRLLDHLDQRNLSLGMAEIFVLDEADQMLDLGFFKPIRRIVSHLPKQRQSLFFSATMPKEIEALTKELLTNPVKVAVTPESTTVERVAQRVMLIEQPKKKALLTELLADAAMRRTLVFTRTKRGADRVAKHLVSHGIDAAAIHGNKSQNQRELALANFSGGKCRVLVATDIAARGIDIDEVTHVVNFELPEVPESYVHRIGRTARAGASGAALSFCDGSERHLLRDIERITRQTIESIDRRNDATLVADRPGNDHSHTPRGGRQMRRDDRPAREGSDRHREGRGSQRPNRSAEDRPSRPEGRSEHRSEGRSERPRSDSRPHARPSQGDRHGSSASGHGRAREEGRRDEIWSNDGGRPNRSHRERRDDRDGFAPRPPRFGDTGRAPAARPTEARTGERSGEPHRARPNDRPHHRPGDDRREPSRDHARANDGRNSDGRNHEGRQQRSGAPSRPQASRPGDERRGGDRGGRPHGERGPHRGDRRDGDRPRAGGFQRD